MSRTLRDRQADWRGRRDLKSALFDVLNSERIERLRRSMRQDSRPEVRALQEYFVAYPRCRNWPASIEYGAEGWWSVDAEGLDFYEIATVYAALAEITSVPVRVEEYREDGVGAVHLPDPETSAIVKAEVAEMRRLNLWGRT